MHKLQFLNLFYFPNLFTLLMVAISLAMLLICCRALLLILQVSDRLVHHVALLLVGDSALLLTLGVKDCPALCLSELIALLLVSNILKRFWIL